MHVNTIDEISPCRIRIHADGEGNDASAYRLGSRSAIEWVIDQYQVSTDKRSGITTDPNREDEPDYIVKLIGKVITVSLGTRKLIAQLPPLRLNSKS
jgi:predicted helicase